MRIVLLSLFPGYFSSPLETSLIGRAQKLGLLEVQLVDIRAYAKGPHATVDDRAYGGGPGMVLMAEPLAAALRDATSDHQPKRRVVYMTPQGTPLTAERCRSLAAYDELVILCGHYEGVDERIIDAFVDEEVSIGDYVLTNGCLSALVLLDATLRFVPGVVGKETSTQEDSFEQGLFDHPHYTRPEVWEGKCVPPVLLSGDHQAIATWRKVKSLAKTAKVRPDLFLRYQRDWQEQQEEGAGEGQERQNIDVEAIALPVASVTATKRFMKECFRWKPHVEGLSKLVYLLGNDRQLIFVEGAKEKLVGKSGENMTFTLPSGSIRLSKKNIATASGICREGDEMMIWWEDPDGYRWLLPTPKET